MSFRFLKCTCATLALVACVAVPLSAQQHTAIPVSAEVAAGSEGEEYLRTLQVAGLAPWYPWSIRGFSPREVERLAATDSVHPWAGRRSFDPPQAGLSVVHPQGDLVFNSAFPYGINNGPRWAGRGITAAVRGGIAGRWGPLSFSLIPEAFISQNAGFEMMDNLLGGDSIYADGISPRAIDLPQRFGSGRYARVDPGESGIRLDLAGIAVGASTGAQFWGPAATHPILLGNNAGGFPHVFTGTSIPVNVGVGRVHGRLVWGALSHSKHALVDDLFADRAMAGLVAVFAPRWTPGLEIGAARFFHSPAPDGFTADLLWKPLEGLLKERLDTGFADNNDPDNQIASVFARWVFPAAGLEVYGEFGREDHSWNRRDLLLQPDHISAYLLGFRRVWARPSSPAAPASSARRSCGC
jgi:hypothetical protein